MGKNYITEEQKEKCKKVTDVFAELYELTDVAVADAGRFGFVRLQWYSKGGTFDSADVYTDSRKLFDELWQIWFEYHILTPVLGTPLEELDYEEIFQTFPKEKQEELLEKREYFLAKCGGRIE